MIFKRKVPFIAQLQSTDCAIACINMLLKYYKGYITSSDLNDISDVGRDGVTCLQLNQFLKKLNFETHIYRIPFDKLNTLHFPLIIFWERRHFVILEKVKNQKFYIIDPLYGKKMLTMEEFRLSYSDLAIYACPNEKFIKKTKRESVLKNFSDTLFSSKLLYFQIFIFSIISYIFTISNPILIRTTLDMILGENSQKHLYMMFGLILLSFVLLSVFNYIKNHYVIKLKSKVDFSLHHRVISHMVRLPYKFFDMRNKTNILYTLNKITLIRDIMGSSVLKSIIDLGAIIFILVYIAVNSTTLFFISFILFIINFIVALNAVIKTSENTKVIFANENKVKEVQDEIVNFILTLKMSALENKFLNIWKNTYNSYINVYKNKEEKNNLALTVFSFINLVSPIIILYFSITCLITNEFTIGQVIAFYFISGILFNLADSLCGTYINIPQCKIILERLSDIVTRKIENNDDTLLKPNLIGEIRLDNVSFSYTKYSKCVLKNINLSIKSGLKVAIVGKSGSGKSTLAKLIAGLYEPSEGKVLFDNINLGQIKNSYIRKQMGVISQDMFLFNRTILSNITMDDKNLTFEKVKEVCKLVQIDQDIEIMPMSYNTIITEMGQNLSGGQRQKILLARALINDPKILIFDEATNCLDNINETIIYGLLSKVGCTRIIIAHRLSTIIDSDLIIVVNDGEIIAQGKHEYLLETDKNYKALYLNDFKRNEV